MVLLFPMKQLLILVKTVFVELIFLLDDLKTINYHMNLLDYYLRQRSFLPEGAIISRPDFSCFSRRTALHFNSIAWVFLSLIKTSGPTTKAVGSEVLPWVVICKVRSWPMSQDNRVVHFIPSRPTILEQIIFVYDFFRSEDKIKGNFNLHWRIQLVPKSIIGQTDMKLKHKEQSIRNYYFQVSMLSSND